ncbi:hypothetical protein [Dactylosporangium salmoneum]
MWQMFQGGEPAARLRTELGTWYPAERARNISRAYAAAGPLTDAQIVSLARLGDADRDRELRLRYPGEEAQIGAAADYGMRAAAPDDLGGAGCCRQHLGDV